MLRTVSLAALWACIAVTAPVLSSVCTILRLLIRESRDFCPCLAPSGLALVWAEILISSCDTNGFNS